MTTVEHALLGVTAVLATGLPRTYGWQLAAMAGFVAAAPDWDGFTLVCGASAFDRSHRVWGHSIFTASCAGFVLAALDYRFDLAGRMRLAAERFLATAQPNPALRSTVDRSVEGYAVWVVTGTVASLSHLLADLVFSGTKTLADWHLQLLWPFSNRGFVYPLVPWGDVGVTLIFVAGMFAMLGWKPRIQAIAGLTLLAALTYILARGLLRA